MAMVDRRGLRVAISSTLFAVPVLVVDNLPTHDDAAGAIRIQTPPAVITTIDDPPVTPSTLAVAATTTTTTAPVASLPPTTAPPTTAAPVTAPPTTSAPTTTAPPAPTTTAAPHELAAPANEQFGEATWYYWRPGECAHRTLERGTVVTVTNLATGASTTCVVTDRGPYGEGKIIDLDSTVFEQIAPLGAGVIDVRITW